MESLGNDGSLNAFFVVEDNKQNISDVQNSDWPMMYNIINSNACKI